MELKAGRLSTLRELVAWIDQYRSVVAVAADFARLESFAAIGDVRGYGEAVSLSRDGRCPGIGRRESDVDMLRVCGRLRADMQHIADNGDLGIRVPDHRYGVGRR